MKKVSLLLVLAMLLGMVGAPALAEESAIKESTSGFYYVEANGDQVALSAADKNLIIEVDGLFFRDLNKNGTLDGYEDWRLPVADRVANLLSQMTTEEKVGLIIHSALAGRNGTHTDNLYDEEFLRGNTSIAMKNGLAYQPMFYSINEFHVVSYLSNLSGHPQDVIATFNIVQKLGEEARLGVPIILASDRTYSTWSGMVDMGRYALSTAGDPDLVYDMVYNYTKEMNYTGNNVILHTYGHEMGSHYGDDPQFLAKMAAAETKAAVDAGIITHAKHYIGRGGRASFNAARSMADLWESWMVGWKAVIGSGNQWIMMNNGQGLTLGLATYMDAKTMDYLRKDLGYNGVVTLDWPWTWPTAKSQSPNGVLPDGRVVADLTEEEIAAIIITNGVDQFSATGLRYDDDPLESQEEKPNNFGIRADGAMRVEVIYRAIDQGLLPIADVERAGGHVLTAMYNIGLFEHPYRDWEEAKELISGKEGLADELFRPENIEGIYAARSEEMNKLEEDLMERSAILFKNDGTLPLAQGAKIYYDATNPEILSRVTKELNERTEAVDEMADADVIILHLASLNDAAYALVNEAEAIGKPVVVIVEIGSGNTSEPTAALVAQSNAMLLQSYRITPGYGNMGFYYHPYTSAAVTVDMLLGARNPGGKTVFEIGMTQDDRILAFGDLQLDIGVDDTTRLYMAQLAKEDPNIAMANNLGDVLATTSYGMSYGKDANIELKWLLLPRVIGETETINSWTGQPQIVKAAVNKVQAGVPFEINFVAENNGFDGHVNAEVFANGELVASRFVALAEGQFRVITMKLTLEQPGEYVITLGDMSSTLTVE